MAKQREMQPRGEFDAELSGRIAEIFNRNKPEDMDPKTIDESKKSSISMNASVMGVVHVSMGLTPAQSAELRQVESQRLRSSLFKTFLNGLERGHAHFAVMHPDMITRYVETVVEQASLYGEKLDVGIPPGFPKPSSSIQRLASDFLEMAKQGNERGVLTSSDLPDFVAYADELNHMKAEDVLGNKMEEYMRRMMAANAALKAVMKGALKEKTGVDLDTDTYITKVGDRPLESEKTTVSWRRVTARHPPERGLTFSALDREAGIIDPRVFPAFEGTPVEATEDPKAVRANLLGQLRWAREALSLHQRGGNMVEAVFAQGPVRGIEGIFQRSYFRLHTNGVVEKALDVVGEQQVLTPHPARVAVMSTVFAVLDKDDKLTFGSHCRVSPGRPAR